MITYAQAVAIDRPLLCRCGSLSFTHTSTQFPMEYVSTCMQCGAETAVGLKVGPKPREWVNGRFDEYMRWIPGHFKS